VLDDPGVYVAPAEFGITPPGGSFMFGGTHSYDSSDTREAIIQSIPVTPSTHYVLSASATGLAVGGPDDHCRVRLLCDTDGGVAFVPDATSPWYFGPWRTARLDFVSHAATVTVGVELEQGYFHQWNQYYVDDVALAADAGPTPTPPVPTPTPGRWSMKGFFPPQYSRFPKARAFTRVIAEDVADLGPTWIRWQFNHDGTGAVNFEEYDLLVSRARSFDLRIMGLVGIDSVTWSSPADWATPAFRSALAARTAEFASRYAGEVEAWEIWNEEDYYSVRIEPEPYAALLRDTFDTVKAADPDALVISGGVSNALPQAGSYLAAVFDSVAFQDYLSVHDRYPLDAVAVHPYNWTADPNDYLVDQIETNIRPVLAAHGVPDMPIWITEIGWNTSTTAGNGMGGADEAANEILAATYLVHLYDLVAGMPAMGPVFWFSYQSWDDQHFGVRRVDWSEAPSFSVYRSLAGPSPTPTETSTSVGNFIFY
jgi:hypothetical protein